MTSGLSCIYTDGLTIKDPSMLATLALFYDEILLPHPYDLDPDCERLIRWPFKKLEDLEWNQERYLSWRNDLHELFDAEVIKVLPAPIPANKLPEDFNEQFTRLTGTLKNYYSSSMVFDGLMALTVHAIFSENATSEWTMKKNQDDFEIRADQVLHKWFNFKIPQVKELHPQEILKLMENLAPKKEGTLQYIHSKMEKYFEILGNVDHDHARAAEILIKSNIEPEFFDLKEKQLLESTEFYAGTLKRVAALTGNIISVIVDPRKWINITSLVETFGGSLEHIFNHYKNHRSKEYRAMQFIGMLKSATKSRRDRTG